MKLNDIVQCIDIHSDLYLKHGEVIGHVNNKVIVSFDKTVYRDRKRKNECIVEMFYKNQLYKTGRKRKSAL